MTRGRDKKYAYISTVAPQQAIIFCYLMNVFQSVWGTKERRKTN